MNSVFHNPADSRNIAKFCTLRTDCYKSKTIKGNSAISKQSLLNFINMYQFIQLENVQTKQDPK